jgi:hypothetical protein
MRVDQIASQIVFMQSATYASLAASDSSLAPALASPAATTTTSASTTTPPASSTTATPSPLTAYNAAGQSTVYGSPSMIGTLLNSLA